VSLHVYRKEAKNLLDLITLIAEALGVLGVDANWCAREDGTLNMWVGDNGPIFAIRPWSKPLSEEPETREG